jgi:hypothetical protein
MRPLCKLLPYYPFYQVCSIYFFTSFNNLTGAKIAPTLFAKPPPIVSQDLPQKTAAARVGLRRFPHI